MKGEWISVNGSKELPIGSWLVEVKDKRKGRISRQVAVVHKNLIVIGNHFDFDMRPVISYYSIEVYSI